MKVRFGRDVEPPADPLFRGNVEWCIPCVCGFAPPKFVPVTAAAALSRLSWERLPSSVGPILHLTHSPLTPDPSVLRLLSLHPPYSEPFPICSTYLLPTSRLNSTATRPQARAIPSQPQRNIESRISISAWRVDIPCDRQRNDRGSRPTHSCCSHALKRER